MPYAGAIVCSQNSLWINDDGVIAIVDLQTGREISRAPGPPGVDLLNGVVISDLLITAIDSADTSYVACFRGSDWQNPVWQFEMASPTMLVAASEKLCCYGKSSHELAGVDLESGAERWSFSVAELGRYVDPVGQPGAGETTSAVAVFGDRVIVGVCGYRIVAIDSNSGKLAWSHEVGALTPASLAVDAAGILHILDFTGYWRVRISDGKLLNQLEVETSLRANRMTMVNQIDVSETHVFAAGAYGTLFAMRQETGVIEWTHLLSGQGRFGNYPIATEGGLWHLDANGNLLRFKVASRRS